MENRIQHLLLNSLKACALASSVSVAQLAVADDINQSGSFDTVDNEFFELGVNTGLINIEDFTSELTVGANVTFKATEDFFLQFNYQRAEAGLSSFEKSQGRLFSGSDREFKHYDLLLGFNLFQAEFFAREGQPNLSAFYLVGGVGNTDFGGEGSFTYTLGAGYQVAIARKIVLRLDYRDYIYTSNLIAEKKTTHNAGYTFGVGYLF